MQCYCEWHGIEGAMQEGTAGKQGSSLVFRCGLRAYNAGIAHPVVLRRLIMPASHTRT